MPQQPDVPLAILGGGNMAQAIVKGGLRAGVLDPARLGIAEVDAARRKNLAKTGARIFENAKAAMDWLVATESAGAGQVVLAVKPQSVVGLAEEIRDMMGPARRIVISILAGTPSAKVRELLGRKTAVVRVMPNLAAQIGRGATAVCLGAGARAGDDRVARLIFEGVGPLVVRIDESMMDAFTAVAASGPAYLFLLAEAMVRGALEVGFDEKTALALVRETVSAAGELLRASNASPASLREAVTSRGGTTAAATEVLERATVMDAIARAITAARDRGRELSGV